MSYQLGQINTAATSKPLVTTYDTSVSSSTPLTLNVKTTGIEVSTIAEGIFLRWDGTASSSAFDGYISPDTTKVFMVPGGTVTANFIESASSATLIVIEF